MFRTSLVLSLAAAGLATVLAAAPARAQTFDKLTYLTFNGPVQIPGVTLMAGSYRFRLTDTEMNRKVVQVLSHDGSYVYSMFHTTPDFRVEATEESVVTFTETPANAPPMIHSLFYGGERFGYAFVYPDEVEHQWQPAITYSRIPVTPEPIETVAEVAEAPSPVEPGVFEPVAAEPVPEAVAPQSEAKELPKTASPLPAVALLGLGSLILGLGAGLVRRRLG